MTAAPQPGTDLAQRTPQQELAAQVRSPEFREQIAAVLPGTLLPERFQRATVTALMINPALVNLDRGSLFNALLRAAQDGLLPDGREAAIVAYNGKASYQPMKDGFVKLAAECGWQVVGRVVYEKDEFEYRGAFEPPRHVPPRPGMERGKPIAAYAIARHRDGRFAAPVVMDEVQIAVRRAKAQTQAVWNEWTDRMREKTVIKALVKELPLGERDYERVARMIAAESMNGDDAAALLYGGGANRAQLPASTPEPVEQPADTDHGGAPVVEGGQQAEPDDFLRASGSQGQGAGVEGQNPDVASGSAPDSTPLPGEPVDEPEQTSMFHAPAGAVAEDADALRLAADAAGAEIITRGGHKGQTVEAVAASGARGKSWIGWAIETPDFEHSAAARTYARTYLPEVYAEAMMKLQTKEQTS